MQSSTSVSPDAPSTSKPLPLLAPDIVIRPIDDQGRHVVKNPRKRQYLRLEERETFLLQQLDGRSSWRDAARRYRRKFDESLTKEEVYEFVGLAKDNGLVHREGAAETPGEGLWQRTVSQVRKQSLLFFRVKLFDPNRILNWLEPRTRWLFGAPLAAAAAAGAIAAACLMWLCRVELYSQFTANFGWQTLFVAWATTIVVTVCHEFGHGLACKRYGGDVHEMGALWIFLTPCLYCNVSDAWLLESRWKRILISLAGTYVDLLIWIPSVFLWRVALPGTTLNYMAWIVATTCGVRVAFNLNPLMRLDGYYAISDWLQIPNLRRQSRARWMEHVRWLLWGAERPQPAPEGRSLLIYGVCSWFFTVGLLSILLVQVTDVLRSFLGVAGVVAGVTVFVRISKRYFQGSLAGELTQMIRSRRVRLLVWAGLAGGLLLVPIRARVGGEFQVRSAVRLEVRAPVAGFLREVRVDEGDAIDERAILLRIEVPELASQITRKEAEIAESAAKLRQLEAGPRPEAVAEQRERVSRAGEWRDLAERDLERTRQALQEELLRLKSRIRQTTLEAEYHNTMFVQAQKLYEQGGLAGQQLMALKKTAQMAESELHEAEATVRARQAEGVLIAEAELGRREKALADTRADLNLLLAGSRPEEIAAEKARLARLEEELKHLTEEDRKQIVRAPMGGVITTPRMTEKIGQYLEKGAVLCVVEDPHRLEAEIAVKEQDAQVLSPGQDVMLKPRALPFHRLQASADRIAPSATGFINTGAAVAAASGPHTVTVYCRLDNHEGSLRSGMTGYGRVYQERRPMGLIALSKMIRLVRTEFWW